jgi:myxalamid-type polyketide synthase MxaE and MxaD
MEKVIKVKSAAWALHTLTAEFYPNQLDAMILFSSTSALFGVSGQGSYVAANTFLDWLSDYRTSKGSLTLSIQWGAWAETGMSVSSDLKELPGENHLKPTEALDALDEVINHAFETFNSEKKGTATATAGVNEIEMGAFTYPIFNVTDWNMYASNSNIFEQGPRGLVEELTGGVPVGVGKKGEEGQDGEENMLDFLLKNVSKDAAADSTSASLADLGLDSLDIINLRNKITQKFGATLPLDRFFDASLSVKSLYTELEGMRSSDK